MSTDRTDMGWPPAMRAQARAAPPPPPAATRIPRSATVVGGVAGALVLGLLLGLWAKPDLGQSRSTAPMQPVTPAQAAKMDVEVAPPVAPSPIPRPSGKLEVLPPGAAQAAARGLQFAEPAAQPPPSLDSRLVAPAPVTQRAPGFDTRYAPPSEPASRDASCAGAGSRAAQMVCADPDLAAADRELNRAYRRALRSGVPTEQLRDEQRDWLDIREEAARRSPRAVAHIYQQRIDELNQIADEGPG